VTAEGGEIASEASLLQLLTRLPASLGEKSTSASLSIVPATGVDFGGEKNRIRWSTATNVNLAISSYIPGSSILPSQWPWYPSYTQFRLQSSIVSGAQIRLYGQTSDGTIVTTVGGFLDGVFLSPTSWASTAFAWEWVINEPVPTLAQSITLSHFDGADWVPYMTSVSDSAMTRCQFMVCPPEKRIRISRVSRHVDSSGYQVAIVHIPGLTATPRSNLFTTLLHLRSTSGTFNNVNMEGLGLEITSGALAVIVSEATSIPIYVNVDYEMVDV